MIAGKGPVSIHSAKVLNLELNQRPSEIGAVAQSVGKGISLELEAAAQNVHQQLDDCVQRAEDIGKQKEPDDNGVLVGETKVGVQ